MKKNPYSSFLDSLEKPARYIGGEYFSANKNWDEAATRVALCFPDAYEIGMSHLGFKILYEELNSQSDILGDRVFAPWIDMEAELRKRDLPLVSLEHFQPLHTFDILGFSLQYEMTYTNILQMLDLGKVPLWQNERTDQDPLVICGGPCATHPEPLAPFMDLIVIGDGEDLFVDLARYISQAKKMGLGRADILKELSTWKGIYVPHLFETEECENTGFEVLKKIEGEIPKTERFFVEDLKNRPIPTKSPIPHMTAIFDRFSVELARGCTEGCRFCQAGMIYRPVRERRPENVIDSVLNGMQEAGFQEASLTCLSTADYTAITPLLLDLLEKIDEKEGTLGISSLRAYGLDPKVMDKMAEVKNSSLTFAPEAGTERMRKVINKNVSEEDMIQTAHDVWSRGWRKMKLYFMIGLPTETDEDVMGIMETGKRAKDIAKQYKVRGANVTVSASSFVPKPHTPFQWASMITASEIERKQEMLYVASRKYGLNFRKHLAKTSYVEGIVARGDRKIANLIYDAFKKGARFDGWNETFDFDLWLRSIEEVGLDPAMYLGTIRLDGRLPWDHIDVGLEDKFLLNEWKRALKDRLSPPCGKPNKEIVHYSNLEQLEQAHDIDKKKLVCYNCGIACDLSGMVEERRDFLTSLGAEKDTPYVRPEKTFHERRQERLNEVSREQVGHQSYRIGFSKIGPLSFISHLDLKTVVARIFRRANIEVSMSKGFNPAPLISFGPALSLGISSLREYFDVKVPKAWERPEEIIELLQKHAEMGLIFNTIEAIEKKSPSIQTMADRFRYFIPFKEDKDFSNDVENILKQDSILIQSFNKKKQTEIEKDIRPLILDLKIGKLDVEENIADMIDSVSPCKGKQGVYLTAQVDKGSSIRPKEISELLHRFGLPVEKPIKTEVLLEGENIS